jgi:hypothetical protein
MAGSIVNQYAAQTDARMPPRGASENADIIRIIPTRTGNYRHDPEFKDPERVGFSDTVGWAGRECGVKGRSVQRSLRRTGGR